ncbi:MAG: metal ABC transporter substrate-binding protein [Oscillospiraceae bacterium]|jgi:zinc transport system substrate-binding protein|nr:metal ABC transporter substrate-binding protein [Oscillospiraceae bacterium]
MMEKTTVGNTAEKRNRGERRLRIHFFKNGLRPRANRSILISIFAALALLIPSGCGAGEQSSPEGSPVSDAGSPADAVMSVYASFYPMYDFAVKIGGDKVNAVNMTPSGTEPHDWEPTAADISGLEAADVFIYNGAGMEHWAEDIMETLQSSKLTVVEASKGIELIEGGHGHDEEEEEHEDEDEEEEEHEEEGFDPHVWLNPMYAKVEMGNIRDAFKLIDPANGEYYDANYTKYAAELDALDKEFTDALSEFPDRDIIVAHQAFGYMCSAYELNQVPIEGLSPDSEPDPARMAEIIEFASEHNINVIYFEELVSPKVAETIAEAIGAETDVLNPLEGLSDDDIASGADYFTVMRSNLEALRRGFLR